MLKIWLKKYSDDVLYKGRHFAPQKKKLKIFSSNEQ